MTDQAQLLPGILDLLILRAVSLGPLHGYGVLLRIGQISGNALLIEQGALYPGLFRRAGALRRTIAAPSSTNLPPWVAGVYVERPIAGIGSRQPSLARSLCNRRKYETSGLVSFTCR